MEQHGHFCVCNYCVVVFISDPSGINQKHKSPSDITKIDFEFLTKLRKKRNEFVNLNASTSPFELRPGSDAVFKGEFANGTLH